MAEEVAADDLVVLDPDPDDRHLRAAVGVQRDEMGERPGLDQLAEGIEHGPKPTEVFVRIG